MRSAWIGVSLVGLALAAAPARAGEVPYLLADVNRERPASAPVSDVAGFFELGGRLLFSTANPDGNGILWSSDGTADGTLPLSSSLCPIDCAGIIPLATWKGLAFLETRARDDSSPRYDRLARTDGTPEGTFQLSPDDPYFEILDVQASPELPFVYFIGCDLTGCRLWRSDGTVEGTEILKVADGRAFAEPEQLVFWQGRLWFVAYQSEGGFGLWSTDGTPQGTRLLTVFPAATYLDPQTTAVWNGRLLFVEEDSGGGGCSLWSTDGTPAGTRRISSLCPSAMVPWTSQVLFFVWKGDTTDGATTTIFAGDGTPAGTHPVATLAGYVDYSHLAPIGGNLFFNLIGGQSSQVWQTDGTGPGTRTASSLQGVDGLQAFRGSLYFTAALSAEHEGGRGLFRIAPGGDPIPLARILHYSGRTLYDPPSFAPAGDRLLFLFEEIESNAELWATDGTPTGTRRVRWFEQLPNQPFPDPETMVSAGGRAFFAASDGVHGRELWQSDGTPEGTRMVVDLAPGGYSSIPAPSTLAITKNYLFFAADNGKNGVEPWALPLVP